MKLWRSMIFTSLLVIGSPGPGANGQTIDSLWTTDHWNGYFDSVNCLIETQDFGYLVTGITRAVGESAGDINLIKLLEDGTLDWQREIGDTLNEIGYHLLQTTDGGYLISATRDAVTRWTDATWIVKTDALGDTVWTYLFAPEDRYSRPHHAVQTEDGGYAITGIVNISTYYNEAYILKLTGEGLFDWWEHYGGDMHYQDGQFIGQLDDGGYIVAGNDDNYYTTGYDFWAFRTTSGGVVVWDSSYALTDGHDGLFSACLADSGLVMVGTAQLEGWALRVDLEGRTVWSRSISRAIYNENITDIVPTFGGGYMVGGWSWVAGQRRDFCFTRLNDLGDTTYTFTVGGAQDDHGQSLVQTYRGEFVMAGTSSSFHSGTSSYVAKLSETVGCCGLYNSGFTGNTNCGPDGKVNLADISRLIDRVYLSKTPLCCEQNGNTDGDPESKLNLADIMRLVDHVYLSKEDTSPCD